MQLDSQVCQKLVELISFTEIVIDTQTYNPHDDIQIHFTDCRYSLSMNTLKTFKNHQFLYSAQLYHSMFTEPNICCGRCCFYTRCGRVDCMYSTVVTESQQTTRYLPPQMAIPRVQLYFFCQRQQFVDLLEVIVPETVEITFEPRKLTRSIRLANGWIPEQFAEYYRELIGEIDIIDVQFPFEEHPSYLIKLNINENHLSSFAKICKENRLFILQEFDKRYQNYQK